MSTYWVNFAKHANPNGHAVPKWPVFSDKKPQVMYFNKSAYPGPVPSADALKVLDRYFASRRTPDGQVAK
jgi:para-nitrobenzyl esterase